MVGRGAGQQDGGEGGERAGRGQEGGGHEQGVHRRQQADQQDSDHQGGDAAGQELEPAGAVQRAAGRREDAAAGDQGVRQGAEAEREAGPGVPVDPGADAGERGEHHGDDAGEHAGQAVHVVAQVGEPECEAEQGEQHSGADEAEGAHQLGAPEPAVGLPGGGDRVGDVVVDGGRQRLGERAQVEQVAVAHLLGGERAAAVEHGAVAADQVEAGGDAVGLGLAGQPQYLGVHVRERDVLGQGDVDPAVRGDDGDPAEAGGRGRRHARTSFARRTGRSPLMTVFGDGCSAPVRGAATPAAPARHRRSAGPALARAPAGRNRPGAATSWRGVTLPARFVPGPAEGGRGHGGGPQ